MGITQSTRQFNPPMLLPYPTPPHHSVVRQPSSPGPVAVTSCPYRALKASVFPKILLKISQMLQGVLMYHIDYLTGRGCRRERLFERCNATLLGPSIANTMQSKDPQNHGSRG